MIRRKAFILFVFFISLGLLLTSCNDDDGVMERPDYTSIKYDIEVSSDFLALYNIEVEYKKINGDMVKEQVKDIVWGYKEKVDGERPIDFQMNVVATARELPEGNIGKAHLLADVSMEYYTKKTSAKRMHQKTIDREITNDKEYVKEHPTIVIANFSTQNMAE
ncbi:MAG: hypothetical protein IKX33_11075 [Prevotella sp.]|nr:hypothetical protein [Prevotella sp.]